MAKHRQISQHSLHARTVFGGVVAGGALLVCAPAGMAFAHHSHQGGTSGPEVSTATKPAVTNTAAPQLMVARPTPLQELGKLIGPPLDEYLASHPEQALKLGEYLESHPGVAMTAEELSELLGIEL